MNVLHTYALCASFVMIRTEVAAALDTRSERVLEHLTYFLSG